ncbi:MAG: hypothetical protein ABEJ56_01625 [Candidatus Nanohaloarchaea archaeon]
MKREDLMEQYRERRKEIDSRLEDFEKLRQASDIRMFKELVFVILTSQTEAEKAWEATGELDDRGLLDEGGEQRIAEVLRDHDVSYEENKSSYIVENRKKLSQPTLDDPSGELKLKNRIDPENLEKTRKWLVDSVSGISWKGASHFLRNIGYGNGFAIISSHILKVMSQLDLIESPSAPENREEYMEYEEKLRRLSEELGIDIKALDLVTWSLRTGEVFK